MSASANKCKLKSICIGQDGFAFHALPPGSHAFNIPEGCWLLDIYLGTTEGKLSVDGLGLAPTRSIANGYSLIPSGLVSTIRTVRAGPSIEFVFRQAAIRLAPARAALSEVTTPTWSEIDQAMNGVAMIAYDYLANGNKSATRIETSILRDLFSVRLLQIITSNRKETKSSSSLQNALEFIDRNLSQSLYLEDVAGAAGLSPYHFARKFRDVMGTSLRRYVILRRLDRAQHLITTCDTSLAEIAYEAGFSSQSHMTSLFKRFTGRTPASYRPGFEFERASG